jgi:hypothetical protein
MSRHIDNGHRSDAEGIGALIGLYLMISALPFLAGLLDARWANTPCAGRLTRIEYIFPAHALGCWLNERRD